jgi:hypothetical protein
MTLSKLMCVARSTRAAACCYMRQWPPQTVRVAMVAIARDRDRPRDRPLALFRPRLRSVARGPAARCSCGLGRPQACVGGLRICPAACC